jgi:hypothetical protein
LVYASLPEAEVEAGVEVEAEAEAEVEAEAGVRTFDGPAAGADFPAVAEGHCVGSCALALAEHLEHWGRCVWGYSMSRG